MDYHTALERYDAAPGDGSASASPPRSVPRTQGRGGAVTTMASGTSSEVYETSGTGAGAQAEATYATMPTSAALAAGSVNAIGAAGGHEGYEATNDAGGGNPNYEAVKNRNQAHGAFYSVGAADADDTSGAVYATMDADADGVEASPGYVHSDMNRQQAEAAVVAHGGRVGAFLLRSKRPASFVLTMCVDAEGPTFANHMLEPGWCPAQTHNSRR